MAKQVYDPDKIEGELCRRKLSRFARQFWDVIIQEEIIWEPHMGALCDEVQEVFERTFLRQGPDGGMIRLPKDHDLIINIPPGTTKSTIVTIMAPVWAWTRDNTLRIITTSYSDALATEHAVKSRDIIRSDKFRVMFPEVQIKVDKDLKTNYETVTGGQRYATSVGGSVTGVHAHVIIVDDPINPEQAASQAEVKRANRYMDKTLSMRKIDKAVTARILIMQRLAVNDPTGHALSKKKVNERWICLPAELSDIVTPKYRWIYEKNGGLLAPGRLNQANIDESRIDLGSGGFAGQMAQRPAPEGGANWKESWFIQVPDENFPSIAALNEIQNDWDLAYTKEDVNSASAFITSGLIENRIYIDNFDWQWYEFPELIKWMKSIDHPHYIEAKAAGKSARQTLRKDGVAAIEVKVNKDKIARAKDASPPAEAGLVYIRKSMADRFFNDPKQGILFFPNGEFGDLADALSQMLVRRTKKGRIVSSGLSSPIEQTDSPLQPSGIDPLDWIT